MKRIIKKIVKVILYTLLILVLAFISIFAWDKVGQKWRELNFKPKPQLTVIGKPFIVCPNMQARGSMSCSTSGQAGAVPASDLSPC